MVDRRSDDETQDQQRQQPPRQRRRRSSRLTRKLRPGELLTIRVTSRCVVRLQLPAAARVEIEDADGCAK